MAQGANGYSYEDKPRALKGSLGYREGVAKLGCEARPACLLVRFGGAQAAVPLLLPGFSFVEPRHSVPCLPEAFLTF